MTRRITVTLAVMFLSLFCLSGKGFKSSFVWDIASAGMEIKENRMHISLTFRLIDDGVVSDGAIVLQPYIHYGDSRMQLTPMSVYRMDRHGRLPGVRTDSRFASANELECRVVSGTNQKLVTIESVVPVLKGVDNFDIIVSTEERRAKNRVYKGSDRIVAGFTLKHSPEFKPRYFLVRPLPSTAARTEVIPLCCRFLKNGNVDQDDPESASALFAFERSLNLLVGDPRTKVSSVFLRCWTGVEGGASSNVSVSSTRASMFRRYLMKNKLYASKNITFKGYGEDWLTIGESVSSSFWARDSRVDGIMKIKDLDNRVSALKGNCPELWRYLDANVLPSLNRLEAVVTFTVKPFKDIDKVYQAYKTDPRLLSPSNYFDLAHHRCPPGSFELNEFLLDAVNYWPNDAATNINAVSILLSNGKVSAAGEQLRHCGDGSYARYFEACWLLLTGRVKAAEEILRTLVLSEHSSEVEDLREQIRTYEDWSKSSTPYEVDIWPAFDKSGR